MKIISYMLSLSLWFIFISCSGCDDNHKDKNDSEFLEQDYDFIAGILAPDSVRNYRHEIFVGKILDTLVEYQTFPDFEDPYPLRVCQTMRYNYMGYVVGTTGATVSVRKSSGIKINFHDVGNGIYRDVNNELHVVPLDTYYLEIHSNSFNYTSKTIIPGNFSISNVNENDTVGVLVGLMYPGDKSYSGLFRENYYNSINSFLYRHNNYLIKTGIDTFYGIDHTFDTNDFQVPLVLDTTKMPFSTIVNTKSEIIAIDSNYGLMYAPEIRYTGSEAYFSYQKKMNESSITKRSSVFGSKDMVGVFGSYNHTKRNFYMRAVRQ